MKPKAFLSYAHWDDEGGYLTDLRKCLIRKVRMFAGTDFEIFQDKADIQWGENWKRVINEALDEVTFFIPIITPLFLNSDACRAEAEHFLEHELQLGRDDMILPLYFVESRMWDDAENNPNDEILQALRRHQIVDWQELRVRPVEDQEVQTEVENLARQIRDALDRVKAAGGQVEVTPVRTQTSTRVSDTGTIISSIPTVQPAGRSSREPAEDRLVAVDMSLIESQTQVMNYYRRQAQDLAQQEQYQDAIAQLDLAVQNGLSVLDALHRERKTRSIAT
jgi:hypothetical protein